MQLLAVGGDERPWCPARKLEGIELLVGVTKAAGVIDDERLGAHPLEELRRVRVRRIEGRVFANEHRIERRHVHPLGVARRDEPPVHNQETRHHGEHVAHAARTTLELMDEAMNALVAKGKGRLDESERRVFFRDDAKNRIHHEE